MSPRAQNEVVEVLSAADASVGWCVMIGSDAGFYAAFLEESAARALYPDLDGVTAGQLGPVGRAVRVPGGYRVSGRWGFGSGSHARRRDRGRLHCLRRRPARADARRLPRDARGDGAGVVLAGARHLVHDRPRRQRQQRLHRRATCSCPTSTASACFEPPRRKEPLYAFNGMFFANMHGVALGLARRAIDVVQKLAGEKTLRPRAAC